jgi:outer membrane immunogenic protein
MVKDLLAGGAAALVLMTSPAAADGMPGRGPVPIVACCAAPIWTGAYVGVGVGGAFATRERSAKEIFEDTTGRTVTPLWGDHDGRSRAFGTVTLGYDQQFGGPWLAGVFVDYDFGNRNDRSRPGDLVDIADVRLSQKDGHAWSIGGRLGILSSPSTLLFVSGGWTRVSTDADLSFVLNGTERGFSIDKDRDGWFVGAGIETKLGWLGSGFSVRGEYRFTRLNDDHRSFTLEESVGSNRRLEFDRDIDVHTVRAVLVYKFGRREEPVPIK